MSSARLPPHSDFPRKHVPVSVVELVKTLSELALAFETAAGENLEKLMLNDYNVTNFFPPRRDRGNFWHMYKHIMLY